MALFVLYAAIAWWLACLHRRTLLGMAIVVTSVLLLLGVGWFHVQLGVRFDFEIKNMQILLYPYTFLVGIVGLYLALLPRNIRPTTFVPRTCPGCAYDLAGLPRDEVVCPECGLQLPMIEGPRYRPSGLERDDLRANDGPVVPGRRADAPLPGREPVGEPEAQHQRRNAPEQRPADRRELPG